MAEGLGQRSAIYDLIGDPSPGNGGAGGPGAGSGGSGGPGEGSGSDDVGTRLAGADDKPDWADGGDSSGRMTSDQKAWAAGGEGVRSLRSGIKKVRARLEPAEGGGSGGAADDFECGAVLQSLNTSWKRYTGDVSGRCGTLAGLLEKAGNDHYKGDQERRAAFEALDAKYEDTAAVGGGIGAGTGDGDGGR